MEGIRFFCERIWCTIESVCAVMGALKLASLPGIRWAQHLVASAQSVKGLPHHRKRELARSGGWLSVRAAVLTKRLNP
jgi:hypothetical protein